LVADTPFWWSMLWLEEGSSQLYRPTSTALAIFLTGGSWSGPLCSVPNVKKPQATGGHTFTGLLRGPFGGPCNGRNTRHTYTLSIPLLRVNTRIVAIGVAEADAAKAPCKDAPAEATSADKELRVCRSGDVALSRMRLSGTRRGSSRRESNDAEGIG
jgi:hypothetical protein